MNVRHLPIFLLFTILLASPAAVTLAQPVSLPEDDLSRADLEAHLRFLAADEMQGRATGTIFNDIAARYIAEQFRRFGLGIPAGTDGYLQRVPFIRRSAPDQAFLVVGSDTLNQLDAFVHRSGDVVALEGVPVRAGYGISDADYDGLDVNGRIVVVQSGLPDREDPGSILGSAGMKAALAAEHGAAALIELYDGAYPWPMVARYLSGGRLEVATTEDESPPIPVFMVNAAAFQSRETERMHLSSSGIATERFAGYNVAGFIPGADPDRADEVVVLVAHFDHIGTGTPQGAVVTAPTDTIYNGARDNGFGTVALIGAAEAFSRRPAERPVLLLAVTGEEVGLLGSAYYVHNPVVSNKSKIFALNADGAGYSDTTLVTVIGWGRTTADAAITQAARRFGLSPLADPAPEQNLFDRSDNVNFALAGVPTLTFSPGFRSFSDPEIQMHYHTAADVPWTVNFSYLRRYVQAFVHTARLIADDDDVPHWMPGDPYGAIRQADGR
jgi:hypothetical protein